MIRPAKASWRPTSPIAVDVRPRVLVVDDNEDFATTIASGLELRGYAAQTAFDARLALDIVAQWRPHAMLVDIALPDMSGWALARLLRDAAEDCPRLIAISAFGQAIHRERSLAAGFVEHLVKPAKLSAILAALAA